jgi:hypothetical protein
MTRLAATLLLLVTLTACEMPLRFCGCIDDHTMELRRGVDYVPTPVEGGEL